MGVAGYRIVWIGKGLEGVCRHDGLAVGGAALVTSAREVGGGEPVGPRIRGCGLGGGLGVRPRGWTSLLRRARRRVFAVCVAESSTALFPRFLGSVSGAGHLGPPVRRACSGPFLSVCVPGLGGGLI